jgi:hypothetical protein
MASPLPTPFEGHEFHLPLQDAGKMFNSLHSPKPLPGPPGSGGAQPRPGGILPPLPMKIKPLPGLPGSGGAKPRPGGILPPPAKTARKRALSV